MVFELFFFNCVTVQPKNNTLCNFPWDKRVGVSSRIPPRKVFDIFQCRRSLDPVEGCEMVTTQTSLIDHGMQVYRGRSCELLYFHI